MVYLQSSPRENPSTEEKNPLKSSIERKHPLDIIENKSSKLMISIKRESPGLQENSYPKHQVNAFSVEKQVITRKSVKLRPKPLSIPSFVTKPVRKKSSNS